MEQYDFRNEMEKTVIEFLRKQAPSVVLSFVACFAMWLLMHEQGQDCKALLVQVKKDYTEEIVTLRSEVRECNAARMQMSVDVAALKTRLDLLTLPKVRR